jgi:hypothetical protein
MSAEVPYPEWVPRMRSREEIEYMLDWLTKNPSASGPTFQRGALATLLWVLGRAQHAPVTGRVRRATHETISQEAFEATTAMYNGGRPPTLDGRTLQEDPLDQGYLQGVESLTMWITGSDTMALSDDWPFPVEAPPAP